jgi:two-component system, OmpR family, response regulator
VKVLLIDDEDDIRRIARLSLAKVGGLDVIDAPDGATGAARAAAESPDVILLDVMMPGQDGPATLAVLRANPATAAIPVVFLTAKAMPDELQRLMRLGVRGVLNKPFDPMTLPAQLQLVLAGGAP